MHCAWYPYSISTYYIRTSFSLMHIHMQPLSSFNRIAKSSLYVHLGYCIMSTAWSAHRVLTYLSLTITV